MKRITVAAAVLAALGAAGCAKVVSPSDNQVETLIGTVYVGAGGTGHNFTVKAPGEYKLTITSLTPPPPNPNTYTVAAQFGSGSNCSGVVEPPRSGLIGSMLLGGPIGAGDYCIIILNPGWFTVNESYTARLEHP
jgi:hypothetical protein